jgi:hypothetical protein
MKISEAMALIRNPTLQQNRTQSWCDLGCDTGTFTMALAQSLASGSTIHAVDLDSKALGTIPDEDHGVVIRKVLADLRSPGLRLPTADGILMANSLHFIHDQHLFIKKLLPLTNNFLIVEYERSNPSAWGPYPVGFEKLRELFNQSGVQRVERLSTQRSRFGGTIYSAFAQRA